MITSADDFFAATGLAEQEVALPGGASVRVRELSVLQRAEFARRQGEDPQTIGPWLVATSCLNGNGFRMFSDEQVGELMLRSPRIIEHIAFAVMRLSGLIKGGDEGNA